mmetsp:Transcript_9088/g.20213  ORF Transcript_9088/g.20213 Transcript_9088/m.20213 type:complete len:244 (+) Transcript_9088:76-807(+)
MAAWDDGAGGIGQLQQPPRQARATSNEASAQNGEAPTPSERMSGRHVGHVGFVRGLRQQSHGRRDEGSGLASSRTPCTPQLPSSSRPQGASKRPTRSRRSLDIALATDNAARRSDASSGSRDGHSIHGASDLKDLAAASSQAEHAGAPEGNQSADAKVKAIAALQRLFFEELARGQDANGAAAAALRRLTESPVPDASQSSGLAQIDASNPGDAAELAATSPPLPLPTRRRPTSHLRRVVVQT